MAPEPADTFRGRISLKSGEVSLEDIRLTADQVRQIQSEFAAGLQESDRAALERALAALK